MTFSRSSARALIAALIAALAAFAAVAAPSFAGTANAGLAGATSNPLTGVDWAPYYEPYREDPSFDPPSFQYNHSSGAAQLAFGQILAQPRFRWFTETYPVYDSNGAWGVRQAVGRYIATVTQGQPDIGVQLGVFRLQPYEACGLSPSRAQQADYKAWIRQFAAGVGNTRAAIDLQPDMPFTLCAKRHSPVFMNLIRYAAQQFAQLPYATTYIDAGAADWLGQKDGSKVTPAGIASMLKRSGIAYARGFSLNLTHYDSTGNEVRFAHRVIAALRKIGIRDKHAVVNTAQNGRPFTTQRHWRAFQTAAVCLTPQSHNCVTLGQPPTLATGDPAIDGYLWLGRPWINNATRRPGNEILSLVTTSPYLAALPAFDTSLLPLGLLPPKPKFVQLPDGRVLPF